MSNSSGFAAYLALALLLVATWGVSTRPVGPADGIAQPQPVRLATLNTLSYTGVDPTTLSLNWTMNTDPTFVEYDLQRFSNILSGWETIAALIPRTNTTLLMTGLNPGSSNSWRILYQDSGSSYLSNVLPTTQSPEPTFSFSMLTDTSISLSWTNGAMYGGLLHFGSYQIITSINGAKNFTFANINEVNTLSIIKNLLPSSGYVFFLNTTDACQGTGCPANSTFTSSLSNKVVVNTPGPLAAHSLLSPSSVDVGQPVSFLCLANGGSAPYTYSWYIGDGTTGLTSDRLTHIFTRPGAILVECAVTDDLGETASAGPTWVQVVTELSIKYFTATPNALDLGQKVTFVVDPLGGNGSLTYSYTNLPLGCSSINSTSITCTPRASGNYDVTVTITDQGRESSTSTTHLSVTPSKVLGLDQATGLAVIYGSISIVLALAAIATVLILRRRATYRNAIPNIVNIILKNQTPTRV